MTPEKFSDRNITNTVAQYLADKLIAAGYWVYWSQIDAMQTNQSPAWYWEYYANGATYMSDSAFRQAAEAATGIMTIVDSLPALPRYVVRPINDGSVPQADEVMVPTLSVEVGGPMVIANFELGSGRRWRGRQLILNGFLRDEQEQTSIQDALASWFDHEQTLNVLDHAAGTMAEVGPVDVQYPSLSKGPTFKPDVAEARTFEVLLHAILEYVA